MERKDKNGKKLEDGHIIDIHQTVNGQNFFLVKTVEPLDIRYKHDYNRKYEYDMEGLLKPEEFTGETTYEVIGKIESNIVVFNKDDNDDFVVNGDLSIEELYQLAKKDGFEKRKLSFSIKNKTSKVLHFVSGVTRFGKGWTKDSVIVRLEFEEEKQMDSSPG